MACFQFAMFMHKVYSNFRCVGFAFFKGNRLSTKSA